MDCEGNAIACDHPEYGKEQNIGLHDVVNPSAMTRVTATETYIVDGIPTTVRVDNAYCPFVPTRAQTIEPSTTTCICTSRPYSCAGGPAAIMCICSPKR